MGKPFEECCDRCAVCVMPDHKVPLPNRITPRRSTWFVYDFAGPALVKPVGTTFPDATLMASPVNPANDAATAPFNVYRGKPDLFIPWGGKWYLRQESATADFDYLVLDLRDKCPDCFEGVGFTEATNTVASVGVASASALAQNTRREYAAFVNDHATAIIYLGLGAAAVVGRGVRLNAAGGSYEMSKGQKNLYRGVVNAIATGAATGMTILEGV